MRLILFLIYLHASLCHLVPRCTKTDKGEKCYYISSKENNEKAWFPTVKRSNELTNEHVTENINMLSEHEEKEWVVVTKTKLKNSIKMAKILNEVGINHVGNKAVNGYVHVIKGPIRQIQSYLVSIGTEVQMIFENGPIYLKSPFIRTKNVLGARSTLIYSSCRYGTLTGETPGFFSWGVAMTYDDSLASIGVEFCTLAGNDGSGVDVYIVDTGINNPSSLSGRIVRDFDFYGGDALDDFVLQHGTFIAGIVGSKIYGLATNVTLHAVKVLDSTGFGSYASLYAGLQYILLNGAPGVINLSLGSLGDYPTAIADLITYMLEQGFIFSVAAGNDNVDASLEFPANVPGVVAVGSYNRFLIKSGFSNDGPVVGIWAPGERIISCIGNTTETEELDGTSMATGFVSGVLALIFQLFPNYTNKDVVNYVYYVSGKNQIKGLDGSNNNRRLRYTVDRSYSPGMVLPVASQSHSYNTWFLTTVVIVFVCSLFTD
jgi:subtilisin family serine protease